MPPAKADVNMDRATYLEPNETYTRIHFSAEHYVDVKETPNEIADANPVSPRPGKASSAPLGI
jgi:hypothetical protein